MEKIAFILIILAVCIIPIKKLFNPKYQKCPACGETLKLEQSNDQAGFSLSKKVSISIYNGPRKIRETWICQTCKYKINKQYWSS